jgi:hypothetical protein
MRSDAPLNASGLQRWWSIIATLLATAVFIEAIFAGAILSGIGWARPAHSMTAVMVLGSTLAAGLVSVFTLRRVPHGMMFGLTLLSLAAVLFLQIAAGKLIAGGANLMWVHVPLGAGLVGFSVLAVVRARKLGGNDV